MHNRITLPTSKISIIIKSNPMKQKLVLALCLWLSLNMMAIAQNINVSKISFVNYSQDGVNYTGTFTKRGYKDKPEWIHTSVNNEFEVFNQREVNNNSLVLQNRDKTLYIDFKLGELINSTNNSRLKIGYISPPFYGPELPIEDQEYRIKLRHSGKYISFPEDNQQNGTIAIQNSRDYNLEQLFVVSYVGNGFYLFFTASSDHKKVLDLNLESMEDGVKIIQRDVNNSGTQQFFLRDIDQDSFSIGTLYGKVLGVSGGIANTVDGAPIQQITYAPSHELQFQLEYDRSPGPAMRQDPPQH